ncbi:hypothetical protein DEA8626_03317 [Defluviimonas aquaemixtae]|uniref:Uncharacterized protein n=1 Tax=Albidovulum aquaemixtae TaxID=1542388 RepID=A0A2R8BLJ1_9RHOB|nr:hypothetical protein DEA8626_03317 [Defluviimonas aquaemixtae]
MGRMGCVECVAGPPGIETLETDFAIGARCRELGLIVRSIVNMCVFSPPLDTSESEIVRMFDILAKVIRISADDLAREGLVVEG